MGDVNELLARLKMPTNGSAPGGDSNEAPYHAGVPRLQPQEISNAFSGMTSPPPAGLSNVASSSERASDRSANLLNLLKFNQPSGAADSSGSRRSASTSAAAKSPPPGGTNNPQEALLKLLNRSHTPASRSTSTDIPIKQEEAQDTDLPRDQTKSQASPKRQPNPQVFTYQNPFDDLAASAPTRKDNSDAKRPAKTPTPLPDGRSQVEALLGIGSKSSDPETVSGALRDAGQQARGEATEAVARAESNSNGVHEPESTKVQDAMQEAAADIKKELKDEDTRAAVEADMPKEMAKSFEDTIAKVASGEGVADSWEHAEAEESANNPRFFSFPMAPFTSLDVQAAAASAPQVRDDVVMKVASMKREFDQVDRTLAAATTNHIVYAMNKGGGFRIIRQNDGTNKHVFKKSSPIFNIGVSQSNHEQAEPIIATAVNGTVYWTDVPTSGQNQEDLADINIDDRGFQLPPLPSQEDNNTSGAQLKTRAKLSSNHPEFFAVARGKSIYVVWPQIAMRSQYCDQNTRTIDSEKYFSEKNLKINTGKAGKDFAFSPDDSTLVSLDKAGRLKFWDIKDHTDPEIPSQEAQRFRQIDLRVPLKVLETSQPEKSWATSVQFVDHEKSYGRGQPLRYLLVGSKQNHTITLFDLGLGKAVQELNFPHDKETDPICSIHYHAKSSIIAVGHPTRNSIFFIHLSVPKNGLNSKSQAEYIERLSRADPNIPRPKSTAIMSGMREISLEGLGILRSLEINDPPTADGPEERVLELYIMHSKGVTCLNLDRQDIGIGKDFKPLESVNGIEAKVVVSRSFEQPDQTQQKSEPSEASTQPSQDPPAPKKEASTVKSSTGRTRENEEAATKAANAAAARSAEPKPKAADSSKTTQPSFASIARSGDTEAPAPKAAPKTTASAKDETDADYARAKAVEADKATSSARVQTQESQALGVGQIGQLSESISQAMGGVLSEVFTTVLSDQLDKLYRKVDEDKRVQEASGSAKQEAVLRLVSSTLTENMDNSLSKIINNGIQQSVVPSIGTVVAQSVDKKVSEILAPQIKSIIPKEVKSTLTPAINKAMQDPETFRIVSELVSTKISSHVESVFAATLQKSIAPSFQNLAVESARRMTGEVDARVREQLQSFEIQHQNDSAKIDQLTGLTTELLQTVRQMAGAQASMSEELSKVRGELLEYQQQAGASAAASTTRSQEPKARRLAEDPELEGVAALLAEDRFEEGTIKVRRCKQPYQHGKMLTIYSSGCNHLVKPKCSTSYSSALTRPSCETATRSSCFLSAQPLPPR